MANEEKAGFALFLNNLIDVFNRDSDNKPLNLAYTDSAQGGPPVPRFSTSKRVGSLPFII
jgi:hypothetical protein